MTNQVLANLSYSGHHHYQKQKDLALKCCEKSAPRYADRLFSSSFYKVSVKVSFRQNPPRSEAEKPIKTVLSETKTFFEIIFNQNKRNHPPTSHHSTPKDTPTYPHNNQNCHHHHICSRHIHHHHNHPPHADNWNAPKESLRLCNCIIVQLCNYAIA